MLAFLCRVDLFRRDRPNDRQESGFPPQNGKFPFSEPMFRLEILALLHVQTGHREAQSLGYRVRFRDSWPCGPSQSKGRIGVALRFVLVEGWLDGNLCSFLKTRMRVGPRLPAMNTFPAFVFESHNPPSRIMSDIWPPSSRARTVTVVRSVHPLKGCER